jgi:hypothetical protein
MRYIPNGLVHKLVDRHEAGIIIPKFLARGNLGENAGDLRQILSRFDINGG